MSAERIAKARGELDRGKLGAALGTLGDIKDTTREVDDLRELHALAEEGLSKAGRFSRSSWASLVAKIEKKLVSLEPAAVP
jgi:hypothetical protein